MITNNTSIFVRGRLVLVLCVVLLCATRALSEEEPQGVLVKAGATVNLLDAWPDVAKAPKAQIGTIEFLIRPDADAIARSAAFIFIMSDQRGQDIAGMSLGMYQGVVRVNALGTKLNAPMKLPVDKWSHVALTINTRTVNKRARLWINGKPVADSLVLEHWPKSFEVAEMFSDRWNLGRVFSGHIGDVRISRTVRYSTPFKASTRLSRDEDTVLLLDGRNFPLSG